MHIEIISGSPRIASVTHRLALYLQQFLLDKTDHGVGLIDMRQYADLPHMQSVWSTPEKAPEQFRELAARMLAADAYILVTPEYNSSYSPAMKNLLDHFPKRARKVFGLATASTGGFGGIRASQQLLLLTAGLFGIASPYLMIVPFVDKKFDADGNLLDESFQASVDTFVQEFLWLGETLNSHDILQNRA